MKLRLCASACLAALVSLIGVLAAPTTASLPGGTSISVELIAPSQILSDPGAASISGTATVGEGVAVPNTLLIYVLDVSASTTAFGANVCGNQNTRSPSGFDNPNTILDCEVLALINLNAQAITAGSVGEVAVVAFGSTAAIGDVSPAPGEQRVTAPATSDDNSTLEPDAVSVLRSAFAFTSGNDGIGLYTRRDILGFTNFSDAVAKALEVAAGSTMPNKIVAFVSDGEATAGTGIAGLLPSNDVVFFTFAVGSGSSCTSSSGGRPSLLNISTASGGTCTNVPDPASLPDILPDLIGSKLLDVELWIDGMSHGSLATTPSIPMGGLDGPATVTFSRDITLAAGTHEVCVIAHGSDVGGPGSVNQCQTIEVSFPPTPPGQPIQTSNANPNNSGAYDLAWAPSDNPFGIDYSLEHHDADDAGFSLVASGLGVPAAFVMEAEGTWTYRARSHRDAFMSDYGPESIGIKVDKTAPNAPGASAGPPNFAPDWYRDSATVTFSPNGDPILADGSAGSGVNLTSLTALQTFSMDGTFTATGTVRDLAGNESAPTWLPLRIDATAPDVDIICPAGPVVQGSTAFATFTASDAGSALASPASGSIALDTTPGAHMVEAGAVDNVGHVTTAACSYAVNTTPVCSALRASPDVLWPANHRWVPIAISGATDADGNALTYTVQSVVQDENDGPGAGNTSPDAQIVGGALQLRAERNGRGDGRVYTATIQVSDGIASCSGMVRVRVPHDAARPAVPTPGVSINSF